MKKLFVYELALLALAFGVVLFDVVYIAGNPKSSSLHKHQQASFESTVVNNAAFSKSCEGLDMHSDNLKAVVQRGFCSLSHSR